MSCASTDVPLPVFSHAQLYLMGDINKASEYIDLATPRASRRDRSDPDQTELLWRLLFSYRATIAA